MKSRGKQPVWEGSLHQAVHETFVLGSFVAAISAKVEKLPSAGESVRARSFLIEAGGKGLNIAVGLQRLGCDVNGVFGVGDDLFADIARAAFEKARLPASMLEPLGGPSGSGVGLIDETGENIIAVFPGANDLLAAQHIRKSAAAILRAQMVIAQFEISDEPILAAFRIAREHAIRTILSPSPFRRISSELLALTTVLIVNRSEAIALAVELCVPIHQSDQNDWRSFGGLASALFAGGISTFVLTLGSAGAALWTKGHPPIHAPAFAVLAIDSTGAGDAFLAGFSAGLARGYMLYDCLIQANACGALMACNMGVLENMPTLDQVVELSSA